MKKKVLLLLLFPVLCFCQKEGKGRLDSLLLQLPKIKNDTTRINSLIEIGILYTNIKPAMAIPYCEEAFELSRKIKWADGTAKSYNALGRASYQRSDYNKASYYYKKVLETTTNKKILALTYFNIGLLNSFQKNYSKAMYYHNQALQLSEASGNTKLQKDILSAIGMVYQDMEQYEKSIAFFKKAIRLTSTKNTLHGLAGSYAKMALSYVYLKKYDQAEFYYKESITIEHQEGYTFNELIFLGSLTSMLYETKQYDKALFYSQRLMQLNKEFDNEDDISCVSMMGGIYLEKAKMVASQNKKTQFLKKAEEYYLKVVQNPDNISNLKGISDSYLNLSEVQQLLKKNDKALASYKKAIAYKDEYLNSETKETIKNLEDKRTIDLKNKEIQLNKIQLEAREKQRWLFIAGLVLLLIIGALLFYQNRNRKKSNEKLQVLNTELDLANKTKARFFSILNHDLRSPVYNLLHFLHLQKENPELLDEESKKRIESKTIASAENLLESMEDMLLWSKGQMENFKPQLQIIPAKTLFEDIQKHFSSEENSKLYFENIQDVSLFSDENYLKTIMRNLTGNAIKALKKTENGTITWKAEQEGGQKYLTITDNGPGGTQEQFKALYDDREVVGIKTGLGLHLIRDLAKAINCKIEVITIPEKGTTFKLILK